MEEMDEKIILSGFTFSYIFNTFTRGIGTRFEEAYRLGFYKNVAPLVRLHEIWKEGKNLIANEIYTELKKFPTTASTGLPESNLRLLTQGSLCPEYISDFKELTISFFDISCNSSPRWLLRLRKTDPSYLCEDIFALFTDMFRCKKVGWKKYNGEFIKEIIPWLYSSPNNKIIFTPTYEN